ncbi:IS110 family transposase [Dyadobacter endophyticus]|uniref:IS110 family transposase n=1 Tax=Dyadobacter endophyticus TaxID=1749036 RepID=UPI003CFBA343
MKKVILGIDISSKTLDICLNTEGSSAHFTIANQVKAIHVFFKKLARQQVVVAMENTGRYNWQLYEALPQYGFEVYVIPALHLKKSLGLVRGKSDKVDAERICKFIQKNQDECVAWKPTSVNIQKMKVLLTERNGRVKIKRQLLGLQSDYKLMKTIGLEKPLIKMNQSLIESIQQQIEKLEAEIEKIIQADERIKEQARQIRSVPGVGPVTCWTMIAKTEGFSTISEPRKMACYCGIVPFDHQSGTSIKRQPRVSTYADKSIKSTLHLAAMSAIRFDNKFRDYYLRKVAEGKNKMSVLNAVRNKIVHTIFALIKNQATYQDHLVLS